MKNATILLLLFVMLGFTPRTSHFNPGVIETEAREFYENMQLNWENLKFDEVFNCFHSDAVCIMNNKIHSYTDLMKLKEYYVKNYEKIGIETEQLIIKPITEESASVTAQYLMKSERKNGSKRISRNIHTMNLLKVNDDWKVISDQINYTTSPLLYSENIEEKYKGNEVDLNYKFNNMLFQYTALFGVTAGYLKEKNIDVDEFCKHIATTYEEEWPDDMTHEKFMKRMRWQVQSFSHYVKILKQDEDQLVFKTDKPYANSLNYGGTEEDIINFFSSVMNEIGGKRGSKVTIEKDPKNEDYLVYSVQRN